ALGSQRTVVDVTIANIDIEDRIKRLMQRVRGTCLRQRVSIERGSGRHQYDNGKNERGVTHPAILIQRTRFRNRGRQIDDRWYGDGRQPERRRERAQRSEPRERSEPAKRLARARLRQCSGEVSP